MKRVKVFNGITGRLVGVLESDDGHAWHFLPANRRTRAFSALGKSFGSVWSSISEFRKSCKVPVELGF